MKTARNLNSIRFQNPSFLLLYSPLQFGPEEMAKPDGSLSLPYLAGSLRRGGYAVNILDISVGGPSDQLKDTFFNSKPLQHGLLRIGMSHERIAKEIAGYDVIGISSIFTTQSSMVMETIRLIKKCDPNKLVLAGGVNARNLRDRFFKAGVDIIVLSEGELTILEIAAALRGKGTLTDVPGICYQNDLGNEVLNKPGRVIEDLDELPLPAWDLLPLKKYWDLSRPHGGQFPEGKRIQYASLQTSRGCPFRCLYCHISKEDPGDAAGDLGSFRVKSIDRVLLELQTLKDLGAEYIFFEDDSLLAKKKRASTLFTLVREMGLHLSDVNGVNLCHLQKNFNGTLGIDEEFLEILAQAGFEFLHLPFESANQRILDKYCSSKWHVNTLDTRELIQACDRVGIHTAGNYMIGYPDETLAEIQKTILFAKQHIEEGMNHAALFAVVPFPGTVIYDMVLRTGQLDADFDTDQMKWTKSILRGLAVSADTLEHLRQLAWLTVNRSEFVNYKIKMRVATPDPIPGVLDSRGGSSSIPGTQFAIL
jgi:anaerobic magnesium-protoporphyrin IX monomethyl ester cyclase